MAQAEQILFVRPSTKLVKVRYLCAILLAAAGYWLRYQYGQKLPSAAEYAIYGAAALWLVSTIFRHLGLLFTSLASDGEKLIHVEGFLTKSCRSMNLAKVQDAKVEQSIGERVMGIGALTLESAGESGRLTMSDIDQPQRVADHILLLARQTQRAAGAGG
jgi:membrane protein YdbS with pleckstrin-like domain